MPYKKRHKRRKPGRLRRAFRGKRRVVKHTSTRKLALINRRMVKKSDDRIECKYLYNGWNSLRVPPARAPVANGTMSTYANWSTQLLTGIMPLTAQGKITPTGGNTYPLNKILTANQREGKDVYISGVHVKAQFFFPDSLPTSHLLPPYVDCHMAIVRERQNNSHNPPPSTTGIAPGPTATIKVPTTVSVFDTANDTAANPEQGNLLWKNMQSGQNYIVAAHKKVRLAGFPVLTGTAASDEALPLPYVNSAKFVDFHYHPKCKVEFNSPTILAPGTSLQNAPPAVYEMVAQKNNIYLIFWSVTPVPPSGSVYTSPLCSGNCVTRFTDS